MTVAVGQGGGREGRSAHISNQHPWAESGGWVLTSGAALLLG